MQPMESRPPTLMCRVCRRENLADAIRCRCFRSTDLFVPGTFS